MHIIRRRWLDPCPRPKTKHGKGIIFGATYRRRKGRPGCHEGGARRKQAASWWCVRTLVDPDQGRILRIRYASAIRVRGYMCLAAGGLVLLMRFTALVHLPLTPSSPRLERICNTRLGSAKVHIGMCLGIGGERECSACRCRRGM